MIGGPLFVLSVFGAIDFALVVTGHRGLFDGQWVRYIAWGALLLFVAIVVLGRLIESYVRGRTAMRAAQSVIDRVRRR
jgi:hypothetical protein